MNERVSDPKRIRAVVFAVLAVALVWQVTTRGFAAYLAETQPETALRLLENEPNALLNQAEARLSGDKGALAETQELVRPSVELALRGDPLNSRALRILGQLADRKPDEERASKLMQAAVRSSPRESRAISWLLLHSYAIEDFAATARYADLLLRTRSAAAADLAPLLARMAEHKTGNVEIKRLLAVNPPWRKRFLSSLHKNISDARTPLELLLSLNDTPSPPTKDEINAYAEFLVGKKLYELAYYSWLQFLPSEQVDSLGLLFNGSFMTKPSGAPFDWTISRGSGVTIDIVARPDAPDRGALFIEFGYGRVEFRPVSQLTMLPPGVYRLRGAYKGEIIGKRGLLWQVACAGGKKEVVGQSPMVVGATRTWMTFEFEFKTPDKDCRAQYVSLVQDARSASEQLVSGSIWFSDLHLERVTSISAAK